MLRQLVVRAFSKVPVCGLQIQIRNRMPDVGESSDPMMIHLLRECC